MKMRHTPWTAHIEFIRDLTFGDTAAAPARHISHIEMLAKLRMVLEHRQEF